MAFDVSTLVTDRTQQDVVYAEQLRDKLVLGTATDAEKAEWNSATLKGAYNHTDLNRVIAAMDGIKARLEKDGYRVDGYRETVKEWSDSDEPREAQMEAYLANVEAIRGVLDVLPTTPETPKDMNFLTWIEANDIEQILVDVETLAQSMRKIYRRSNQVAFYSGFGLWFTVADELEAKLLEVLGE